MRCDWEVREKLTEIFKRRTGIDFGKREDMADRNVFDAPINLPPRELVLIYMDVAETFGIDIPRRDVLGGRFCSFSEILAIVGEALMKLPMMSESKKKL